MGEWERGVVAENGGARGAAGEEEVCEVETEGVSGWDEVEVVGEPWSRKLEGGRADERGCVGA